MRLEEKRIKVVPLLRVNFVKQANNIHELNDFIEYWSSKADGIGVQNLIGIMNANNEHMVDDKTIDFKCAKPFYHMTIRYDGTMLPCCSFFGAETPVAKVKTSKPDQLSEVENLAFKKSNEAQLLIQSIEEAWNGKQMNFFRDLHKKGEYWKHPVCNECVLKSSHADETMEL